VVVPTHVDAAEQRPLLAQRLPIELLRRGGH
jgi:hypothetical protein